MLIAVTGGTGFLGRYIVRRLTAAGHTCRCWYRPESDRTGFDDAGPRIQWVPGELGDTAAGAALLDDADAVVHAALQWRGSGRRAAGETDTVSFLRTNLLGSLELIESAYRARVGRFVFISTCAVHEIILPDRPLDENHPLWPTSHYGAHKAAIEAFVSSYGRGHDFPICSLRPTGIYGLDYPPRKSRWYDIVKSVAAGRPFASDRGGKEVHAADVARAVEILLATDGVAGECYNCYDLYISERRVAEIARELSGSGAEIAGETRGPRNQINTGKLRSLGIEFGGEPLLRQTVQQLLRA